MSTSTANAAPLSPLRERLRASLRPERINEAGLIVGIVALYLFLGSTAPGFISASNQLGLLRDAATVGIAAWGVTLVIVAGEIDISIGPAVAFTSVLVAQLTSDAGLPFPLAAAVTFAAAAAWGALAGWLRARFNVPSFIATLGLWSVLRGLGLWITNSLPVPLPRDAVTTVLAGSILGIPTPAIVMLVSFGIFSVVARRTRYGRSIYAIGGNAHAARLAGIPIARIRVLLFATTGLLSAITGVLLAARLASGNGGAANGLEFDVIAAVVIGGTALAGGRGTLLGTLLGVFFVTLIGNGLVLSGVNSQLQAVVRGGIIVVAVIVNAAVAQRFSPTGDG